MSSGKSPSDFMSSYLGVDITDIRALRKIFGSKASGRPSDWPKGSDVIVSRALYDKYVKLYDLSLTLADALDAVLDCSEHQLVMTEARKLGYDLPDYERFRDELVAYRAFLAERSPYNGVPVMNDTKVRISTDTVDMLQKLTDYNCFMVGRVFSGCFKTEYMKHFGFLKRHGFHYAGATALQETMNVLVSMIEIRKEIDREIARRGPNGDVPPPSAPQP